jgi:DNA-binding CsgD family transcriptional regulator/PAS domain-containing protein
MLRSDTIDALADAFHEAAFEPEQWPGALQELGDALGESSVVMSAYAPSAWSPLIHAIRSSAAGYWGQFQQEHGDPATNKYIPMLQAAKPGSVVWPRTLLTRQEWLDDFIYRKFLRPDDLHDGLATTILHDGDGFTALATLRKREYRQEEVSFLAACMPHLRRALQVGFRIESLTASAESRISSLEAIQSGVILVDSMGRVIDMNAAARRIVGKLDGLSLGRGRVLTAGRREDSVKLQRLIAASAAIATSGMQKSAMDLDFSASGCSVQRPSGSRPLALLVAPLRTTSFMGLPVRPETACIIIFVSDPDQELTTPARLIAEVHGLTPSEAELVSCLLAGHDLKSAAPAMNITMNTAKTLLQRCFERTGTHRQTELLMQVLRGPLGQARVGAAGFHE